MSYGIMSSQTLWSGKMPDFQHHIQFFSAIKYAHDQKRTQNTKQRRRQHQQQQGIKRAMVLRFCLVRQSYNLITRESGFLSRKWRVICWKNVKMQRLIYLSTFVDLADYCHRAIIETTTISLAFVLCASNTYCLDMHHSSVWQG